jgi:hypothetical protein
MVVELPVIDPASVCDPVEGAASTKQRNAHCFDCDSESAPAPPSAAVIATEFHVGAAIAVPPSAATMRATAAIFDPPAVTENVVE